MQATAQQAAAVVDAATIEGRQALGALAPVQGNDVIGAHPAALNGALTAMQRPAGPGDLLALAVQRGASMEQLEKLMGLVERHEANEARKAFVAAMSEFKKVAPTITKDKTVTYTTDKGETTYDHATLGAICEAVIGIMGQFGLSHSWRSEQQKDGVIKVTCVLRHSAGHVDDDVWLEAKPDGSGGKNSIQAIGSAVSYLQRYTLLLALGLGVKGMDDDAKQAGARAIEQAQNLAAALVDKLTEQLKTTTEDAAALKLWQANNASLVGSPTEYERFKDEVVKHRTALRAKKEPKA